MMKKQEQKQEKRNDTQKKRIPVLYQITNRTVLFLFLVLCGLLVFYIIGNYQVFLDYDQKRILSLSTFAALLLAFFSVFSVGESFFYLLTTRQNYPLYIVFIILMVIIFFTAVLTAVLTGSVSFLSSGM
ncbi:MAG: hypothetical protein LKF96_09705 [Treponema sp.]|jgi:sterol desaturase/sphingolipid hydroxylase (fatty acid hydroxylase superfamily)|nr:hypothetical protein [Treponema sp.]